MNPTQGAIALSIGLFVGMVACLDVGYRLGHRSSENPDLMHEGVGAIEAAVFARYSVSFWGLALPVERPVSTLGVN